MTDHKCELLVLSLMHPCFIKFIKTRCSTDIAKYESVLAYYVCYRNGQMWAIACAMDQG